MRFRKAKKRGGDEDWFDIEEHRKRARVFYWGRHSWFRSLYYPFLNVFNKEYKIYAALKSRDVVRRQEVIKDKLEDLQRMPDYPHVKLVDVKGRDAEAQQMLNSVFYHVIRDKRIRNANPIAPPAVYMVKGASGSGKTFLVRGIMNESIARGMEYGVFIRPVTIVASDVFQKWYGESSAKIGRLLDDAMASPSIVFIDEAQTFAAKGAGSEAGGGDENSKVQGTILQKLDMIQQSDIPCLVIFSTNEYAGLLDTMRRRATPIDLDLNITSDMIDWIIDAQKKKYDCDIPTADIHRTIEERLRSLGHGQLVPSDIVKAFEMADQEVSGPWLKEYIKKVLAGESVAGVTKPKITLDDIERVTVKVRSYTEQELTGTAKEAKQTVRPPQRLKDVGGLAEVKDRVITEIVRALHPEEAKKLGIDPSILNCKFLFFGPPGTGKTLLARAIAGEYNVPFFYAAGPKMFSGLVGSSEKNVRDVFVSARKESPCIVFFDEIDAIGAKRGSRIGDAGVSENVLTSLLTELDGFLPLQGVCFIASTNRKDMLDEALLERLNRQYEFSLPKNAEEKKSIVRVHYDRFIKEYATDVTFNKVFDLFMRKTFSPRVVAQTMEQASSSRFTEIMACIDLLSAIDKDDAERVRAIRERYSADFRRLNKIYLVNQNGEKDITEFWRLIVKHPEDHKVSMLHIEEAFEERSKNEGLEEAREMQRVYITDVPEIGKSYGLTCDEKGQNGLIAPVEAQIFPAAIKNKGTLDVFGTVHSSIVESAKIARTYFRRYNAGIMNYDIVMHLVHVSEGAGDVTASGPSAGMAIAMAMLSALTSTPIKPGITMTGKIEMAGGKAGAVGGLAPKRGAGKLDVSREEHFRKVIIPKVCYDDLIKTFPDYVKTSKDQGCEIVAGEDVWDYASFLFDDSKEELIKKLTKLGVKE
jgi:SpoVK/Ycf46/Vps4 family AAA+-type ATPase